MIHKSAVIHESAVLGNNVNIEEYSIIGKNVFIGNNVTIGSYSKIYENTHIADNNYIASYCSIGSLPNVAGFVQSVQSNVMIGSGNVINDMAVICRSKDAGGATRLGSNNHIGPGAYIGHDGNITDNVIVSAYGRVSGFVKIAEHAHIGMNAFIHQFTNIGQHAMIGAMAKIVRDIPPYLVADASPGLIKKVNETGLKRNNFSESAIEQIKEIYIEILASKYPQIDENEKTFLLNKFGDNEYASNILNFIFSSKRGCTLFDRDRIQNDN